MNKLLTAILIGMALAGSARAKSVNPYTFLGDHDRAVLRHDFEGAPPPPAPVTDRQRSMVEFSGRLKKVYNREAHRLIQDSRRAALDEYRNQVRLLTPAALAAARAEAVDWSAPDSRPRAESAAAEVYREGEAKARLAGIEAAEIAWKDGYLRAKQAARRIAREYERKLDAKIRRAAIQVMLDVYRTRAKDRAVRAVQERDELVAKLREEAAAKVAAKLAEAERVEFARLQKEADAAGLVVYQEEEEKAYQEARTLIDGDQPVATEWDDVVRAEPRPRRRESWLLGMPGGR